MNEDNKVELHEDEINAVSGGLVVVPPYKTSGSGSIPSGCFFKRESDTKYRIDPNGVDVWWACTGLRDLVILKVCKNSYGETCSCWGTDSCVGMWHKYDAKGSHK